MIQLNLLQGVIITFIFTHLTIVSVTLYLHRSQAHKSVEFHPVVNHFFRFWIWLTTGMTTKAWVAVHRKHHLSTDIQGDPHSPHIFGIWKLIFGGWSLYHQATKDPSFVLKYGAGTPRDKIERFYTRYYRQGFIVMLILNLFLFGWWGCLIWGVQMIWIPFCAAGLINGLGHWWGYRNGETNDYSHNISPIGIFVGGEELHNNHHLDINNPKFSHKKWEFDIGWMYIRILEFLNLAKLKTS